MDIFLSAEIEGPAAGKWFVLQKEFAAALSCLNCKNYGDELTSIGIISILMREEFFVGGCYKERAYYSRKRKDADIRLRIDYQTFIKASKERQKEIYLNHIIESIRVAGMKAGKSFQTERLVEDVKELLS